ncbi:recombinase family protein [Paracoccus sp. NGMCC 1.201697]|uniref:Recombinase family protein n=1 Tax=Paracoccus broussonetiae subsp. drimophilus TaxID=3373869 RepID=A0ABW7LTA2_9RHOB
MGYSYMGRRICDLTERMTGDRVRPHLFRDVAAATLARGSPEHARLGGPLLGAYEFQNNREALQPCACHRSQAWLHRKPPAYQEPITTRAAIYARYSSQNQREASIEDKMRLCVARSDREGYQIIQHHADMAISGASMPRPGLQSLVDAASHRNIDLIIDEALDRLRRDQADVATLYKRLSFHGVRIVTWAEGQVSEMHVGLKGTMNQLFLKDLAAKTRRDLRGRVEAGFAGGGISYGYDIVRRLSADGTPATGEHSVNHDEAEVVRRIFLDFSDGPSPKAIAKKLNAEGISGPRGQLWARHRDPQPSSA